MTSQNQQRKDRKHNLLPMAEQIYVIVHKIPSGAEKDLVVHFACMSRPTVKWPIVLISYASNTLPYNLDGHVCRANLCEMPLNQRDFEPSYKGFRLLKNFPSREETIVFFCPNT